MSRAVAIGARFAVVLLLAGSVNPATLAGEPQPATAPAGVADEQAVRRLIREGFGATLKEEMTEEDLSAVTAEVLRNYQSFAVHAGRRRAEELIERRRVGEFAGGEILLQLRAGAGGGNPNQIFMHGKKSIYVRKVQPQPLDLEGPINIREDSQAYFRGGYIPKGKALVVRSIEYRGTAKGDTNGRGSLVVVVGGQKVHASRDQAGPIEGRVEKWIVIPAGQEDKVYLEVANSSRGEVKIVGDVVDAAAADASQAKPLTDEQKAAVDRLLTALDAESYDDREKAQVQIIAFGPAVVGYLKSRGKMSPEAESRLAAILDYFGERR